ncbi:predicted protein [Botrytis cinerea T4]|uniref:Uncharacterized protein n=1 Tax=Botryotinia fuckeliana (strain T4) TaxID=999810 RepID=G2YRK6_BOTF4|nr:predicted protein [Botrytis cinerea T4]
MAPQEVLEEQFSQMLRIKRCSPLSQEFCDVLADEELYYFFPKKKSNHSTCHRISQKKTEENFLAGNL